MLAKFNWNRGAQLTVILLSVFTLKQYYSTASVNQLQWILAPTTALVQLATGLRFYFESYSGYINTDRTFVIAASCAGVNFFITAFLMLTLRPLWKDSPSWKNIPLAAAIAYVATVVANTIRISTAVQMQRTSFGISSLSGNQLHRFEGIFVYFGFLLLLFLLSERILCPNSEAGSLATKIKTSKKLNLLRLTFFPLLIYYATALGIPLANAVFHHGSTASEFWEHSIFVLVTPLILLLPLAAFRHRELLKPEDR